MLRCFFTLHVETKCLSEILLMHLIKFLCCVSVIVLVKVETSKEDPKENQSDTSHQSFTPPRERRRSLFPVFDRMPYLVHGNSAHRLSTTMGDENSNRGKRSVWEGSERHVDRVRINCRNTGSSLSTRARVAYGIMDVCGKVGWIVHQYQTSLLTRDF